MPTATWNGVTIAKSDDTVIVDNNHYFPRTAVRADVLRESATHTVCPWKGTASYYSIEVDGDTNTDAAWYYPAPKDAAADIADTSRSGEESRSTPDVCSRRTLGIPLVLPIPRVGAREWQL